jgi:hypothetical protein
MPQRATRVRFSTSARHGTGACGRLEPPPAVISSTSAAFTDACWCGSSRNQRQNAIDQATPTTPNSANEPRQPTSTRSFATIGWVTAPPIAAAASNTPKSRPCSRTGSQRA